MLKRVIAAASIAALCSTAPAFAVTSGDVLRGSLYSGLLARGTELLTPAAEAGDQEAKFGLGTLRLLTGLEGLVQAFYRHGIAAPDTRSLGLVLGVPFPPNADPEPLDYEGFRAILSRFVDDLDAAQALLLEAGESGDYVVRLDPMKFRLDVNDDGRAEEAESVAGVVSQVFGGPPPTDAFAPQTKVKPVPNKDGTLPPEPEPGIGFDRADAIWMAGYANVIASQADFFLAHDFSEFFNAVFHRVFPRAGLPLAGTSALDSVIMDPETDTAIADAIAAIHTINWPVTEPERLRGILERARTVTALSRQNWAAILAETDDNAELIPSPRQTPQVQGPDGAVTQEMVDAWLATLDTVDQILDGELLLPHWRFRQGFDLRAYFETATRTDLVMILTGYGAMPFLKDGPVADMETFAAANRVFGGDLMGYAFWFN